jgi:hypothetical protein
VATVASYLAGASALARLRHPQVAVVLGPLIEAGLVATCGVIEFELGWATRSGKEFDELRADRNAGYEWLPTHDEDWRRALYVQAALMAGIPASTNAEADRPEPARIDVDRSLRQLRLPNRPLNGCALAVSQAGEVPGSPL